jgi:hypothetical protein
LKTGKVAALDWAETHASRAVFILGAIIGAVWFAYYYANGLTTAHFDAKAHLVVARRIVDSIEPGYVQMGTHWLPLIHLLYLPFVLFDYQYRTALGPSLVSVFAFVLSGWLVYRISSRVTGSNRTGLFASIVLLGNPNLQYLQSCPLTEPIYMALLLLAVDGLLQWRDGEGPALPWLPAVWAALGALCRYEGWYFVASVIILLLFDIVQCRSSARRNIRAAVLYLGSFILPVAAHFAFLYLRVGDSFLVRVVQGNPSPSETYRRPLLSLGYHAGELIQMASAIPLLAAVAGLFLCLAGRRIRGRCLPLFLLWTPSLINISALYWGMIYRVRYSALLLPAVAVFASLLTTSEIAARRTLLLGACLVMMLPWLPWSLPPQWRSDFFSPGPGMLLLPVAALLLFLAAASQARYRLPLLAFLVLGMQFPMFRGEYRALLGETLEHEFIEPERKGVLDYLRDHYDGSRILVDIQKTAPLVYDSGLRVGEFIYNDGDRSLWNRVIEAPYSEVGWICCQRGDEIWSLLQVDPHRVDRYALALRTENFLLYRSVSLNR